MCCWGEEGVGVGWVLRLGHDVVDSRLEILVSPLRHFLTGRLLPLPVSPSVFIFLVQSSKHNPQLTFY